ncbi:SDR family NAD(P)-dependent oxidoreductase [Conexibacter arvalis]|uniref:3-oxoacyl-[acyl-carrier protein] reductase n=1 Tax=Conexibacter arvalis TaxID=912552 RepID=A0A840I9Y2_9ACTN|nr:SDR family oxidoreductase [Conexibacter arvalis]MBB4660924.1 3-oxoacyl-[acyl-carrier protein] reductase [Conexibacter arvalis]
MSDRTDPPAPRRALVTGASSGIGAATAVALAAAGCELLITYARDAEGAAATAAACAERGAAPRVARLDLRDPASIDAVLEEARASWGELHVLVNNGGICPYTAADEITVDEWDAVNETNARGTFLMLRGALPLLRAASGDRSVVNVASLAGQAGGVSTSVHYAASKGAILALSRTYARLLAAEGIRVNVVAPGPVESGITSQLGDARHDDLAAAVPLRRFGRPEEAASAIALLASPAAGFTTGATYDVNGGLRIDA